MSAGADASRDFTSATGTPVFHNIFGATVYNLSESGPAGYTASAWSCDGGTQSGASISVPLGGAVTCTITNTDNTPTLKLVKIGHEQRRWHGDGGGLHVVGGVGGCGRSRNFTSATGTPVFHNIFGATVYNLSESGPAGYTASAWSCDSGTQSGASISVPLGGAVTCTIINTTTRRR